MKRKGGAPGTPAHTFWTPRALRDLGRIGDFIAQDKPIAAAAWVTGLLELGDSLVEMPLSGRAVPELARPDVREQMKGGYRLVYQLKSGRIRILAVFESHRRFPLSAKSIR